MHHRYVGWVYQMSSIPLNKSDVVTTWFIFVNFVFKVSNNFSYVRFSLWRFPPFHFLHFPCLLWWHKDIVLITVIVVQGFHGCTWNCHIGVCKSDTNNVLMHPLCAPQIRYSWLNNTLWAFLSHTILCSCDPQMRIVSNFLLQTTHNHENERLDRDIGMFILYFLLHANNH